MRGEADQMNQSLDQESAELKKAIESGMKISKEIAQQREKLEKSKKRFGSKNKELEHLKI